MELSMKISLFIPTYKDLTALELILEALERQTYKNFEVIVSEDCEDSETPLLLKKFDSLTIKHLTQPDRGNRKTTVLNKALPIAEGEYFIFIDGDTIPFSTFIEAHRLLSEPKTVLCGRRVNVGDSASKDLRQKRVSAYDIEKNYLKNYNYLKKGGTRHYEQGLYFKPNSWMHNYLVKSNKNLHILGSNFSCFKEDIFAINGFDVDIVGCSKDDVDLEWRLIDSGCKLKSCKNSANLFHLHHERASRTDDEAIAKEQMKANREKQQIVCKNGINQL